MSDILAPVKMTMKKFISGDYPGTEHSIYIAWYGKAGDQALYVGMSRGNLWNRWFSRDTPHIWLYANGHMRGNSVLGQAVVSSLPESLKWSIEFRDTSMRLEKAEELLIQELRPIFNYVGSVELTESEIELKYKLTQQDLTSAPCDYLRVSLQ